MILKACCDIYRRGKSLVIKNLKQQLMPGTIYKPLFEVQLLHEYYLTDSNETTVFQDTAKKELFLENMFDIDAPSISSSISY